MSFFKSGRKLVDEDIPKPEKLRYVIDKDGKGRWIRPNPPMPIDYDEDIPC